MAVGGILYTFADNFRSKKILISAQYSKADVKVAEDFKFGESNKADSFLKKFPHGKVPAFESADGTYLFESNAIAFHVANEALSGGARVAEVLQWMCFGDNELLPAACNWVFPVMGIMQFNKQNTERAKEDVKRALNTLNLHLSSRTFLVGERITLADIAVASNLFLLYEHVFDLEFRKAYVNVNRWFVTLIYQPEFKNVIGDFKLCTKMGQFDPKKFAELQGKQVGKKESKPKQEKGKAPPAKPKQEETDDMDDDVPKPPSKDPFAHLPKGSMDLDEWKRTYSNEDTEKVAMPYFWSHFDKENFSIWYCEYKFPEELKLVFMSANLIGGMMQRLDRMRKHSFGSMCLFGEDNKSTISGVWFWRGQDLAFKLSEDLQTDYESYSWKKLNFDNENDRATIQEYYLWEGNFDGKKFNQGKIFK